jgi:hypothetical protein
MGELIIECPRFGSHSYLINTQVIEKQLDNTVENILKYYHPEALIDFKQLY